MKLVKSLSYKGDAAGYSIILVVLIAVGVVFALKYHNDHKNDITIHPPIVDVH